MRACTLESDRLVSVKFTVPLARCNKGVSGDT